MNKKYIIEGGLPLVGEVPVWGAKNAISKQLVASLLTDEPCYFYNVPRLSEIETVLEMLAELGSKYEWIGENSLMIHTPKITNTKLSQKYSGVNRIPILFVGVLLNRVGEAIVPFVGGCNIGARPIDFHIDGLKKMGASFEETESTIKAITNGLVGCNFVLPFPSIGATENLILAATLAKGTTVISNAAIEPEIIDTILVLQKMGAEVYVDADRKIIINGVERLSGVSHEVIPDRMEIASLAAAAIATSGRVKILNAKQEYIITLLNTIRKMGGGFTVEPDGIIFFRKGKKLKPVHIETDVHPSFMTDWQQPFVVALTQAEGASVVHETIYENRFGFTDTLNEMGANIKVTNACLGHKACRFANKNYLHSAIIIGETKLKGKKIVIPDLRAGFAYVIAALVADGVSEITGIKHLERGHADLPNRLAALGASIKVYDKNISV